MKTEDLFFIPDICEEVRHGDRCSQLNKDLDPKYCIDCIHETYLQCFKFISKMVAIMQKGEKL